MKNTLINVYLYIYFVGGCVWMMFACFFFNKKNVEEEVEAFKEARKYVCWFISFFYFL